MLISPCTYTNIFVSMIDEGIHGIYDEYYTYKPSCGVTINSRVHVILIEMTHNMYQCIILLKWDMNTLLFRLMAIYIKSSFNVHHI